MNSVKSLWASVMGNPTVFKTINGWLTVFWIVMIPVSVVMGWTESVTYVSALSIYALITGHLSTWQAARVEVKQEHQEERQANDNNADLDKVERKVDEIHSQVQE